MNASKQDIINIWLKVREFLSDPDHVVLNSTHIAENGHGYEVSRHRPGWMRLCIRGAAWHFTEQHGHRKYAAFEPLELRSARDRVQPEQAIDEGRVVEYIDEVIEIARAM